MKIGFIGLGRMGCGMAANLQKAGHQLVVNDLFPDAAAPFIQRGAKWAETPRQLAEECDVVFTSLPTPNDVEAVGFGEDGLCHGLRPNAVWFDLSTNAVDRVRDMHERLARQDVRFLDAPVSGGPAGAASGKLAIWVGGDKACYEKYKSALDDMADQARYIGEIGAGTISKLVHNIAVSTINSVMGEAMTLGVKAGLEPAQLFEAIRTGVGGRMRMFDSISRRFLQGKLDPPNFALRLVHKDIMLATQLGRDLDVPLRLCGLVQQEITEAMNRGWGDRDAQAYLLLQQERAGVPPFAVSDDAMTALLARS